MKLLKGNNMELLKTLEDNSVDSCVTDSPYGLKFMGKKWDYEVPSKEFWEEIYRVLKPGGHVLSFGGTRTYHRMVVNMEDAGFEIRDCISWLYGSGFPKSLNIGKQVDKIQGNEREVVGERELQGTAIHDGNHRREGMDTIDITKGTSPQEGWGTGLKPATEKICVARKPEEILEGTALNLIYKIKTEIWKLYVNVVEKNLESSSVDSKEEMLNIAHTIVGRKKNIQEDLQDVMDMLQSKLMVNFNLSIVSSWLNILGDLSQRMSKYTTEMKSSLIIELKTLNSLEWQNILENITHLQDSQINGDNMSVSIVEKHFQDVLRKLQAIQILYVEESVSSNILPIKNLQKDGVDEELICMARKPISEKTITDNVLKWGTGGINVDGCRIGTEDNLNGGGYSKGFKGSSFQAYGAKLDFKQPEGRFPANIILDEEAAKALDNQSGVSRSGIKGIRKSDGFNENSYGIGIGVKKGEENGEYGDKGGASRFFYVTKVSKKERNLGLDGFEEKASMITMDGLLNTPQQRNTQNPKKNNHPTVKPINLLTYLVRLVTPTNGIVLDPYMGSGSTGIATLLEGFDFIGMELDEDYFKIASQRISKWEEYKKILK